MLPSTSFLSIGSTFLLRSDISAKLPVLNDYGVCSPEGGGVDGLGTVISVSSATRSQNLSHNNGIGLIFQDCAEKRYSALYNEICGVNSLNKPGNIAE
jgi:hypothetical protein